MLTIFNQYMEKKLIFSYEITLACNLRCSYCYVSKNLDNKKRSNPKISKMVVEQIKHFKEQYPDYAFELDLLGGDPLVAENIWEFLDAILQLDIDVWIITNLMMSQSILEKAKEYLNKYPKLGIAATWHTEIDNDIFKKNLLFFKDSIKEYYSRTEETWYYNFVTSFVLFNNNKGMYEKAKWCLDNDIHYGLTILYDDQMLYRSEEKQEWNKKTIFVWKNSLQYNRLRYYWGEKQITHDEFEDRKLYQISHQYNLVCHVLNWHITFDGELYNSCNYHPLMRSRLEDGIKPKRIYCKDMDCKCSHAGCKYIYGEKHESK